MAEKDISKGEIISPAAMGVLELSKLYRVSEYTMRRWLKPIRKQLGERIGQKYSPKQVQMIFDHLNPP
ncbi:MAG: hypothetical protein RB294_10175 [Bacteroidales bacterium]|jgi:hypothetical protein|nr:hypothetical protein [Bacteroidales bacterium]